MLHNPGACLKIKMILLLAKALGGGAEGANAPIGRSKKKREWFA